MLNAWLRLLVVGLSLFLAFSGGSWALMHWLSASIQSRIETLAVLDVRIDQARETLAEIEETSWGVTLREIDGERFVVLPEGDTGRSALERGRAACLEAFERVRELYDRARTAVDDSLADVVPRSPGHNGGSTPRSSSGTPRTSKPCGSSFEQQAAESETLRQRVERLSGLVTRLAQDYETLAAILRGRWT